LRNGLAAFFPHQRCFRSFFRLNQKFRKWPSPTQRARILGPDFLLVPVFGNYIFPAKVAKNKMKHKKREENLNLLSL
jgi:hypothetical protein